MASTKEVNFFKKKVCFDVKATLRFLSTNLSEVQTEQLWRLLLKLRQPFKLNNLELIQSAQRMSIERSVYQMGYRRAATICQQNFIQTLDFKQFGYCSVNEVAYERLSKGISTKYKQVVIRQLIKLVESLFAGA